MPCRAFSERLGREDPVFETGVRRLMCPAGHWKQGWSLLVCRFFAGAQNDKGVVQNDMGASEKMRTISFLGLSGKHCDTLLSESIWP